ncbi:phospholipase C [Nocardia sp. GAS34]|uniref:phosphocholine-specific phospholipase C n=1 Tax=unclassified Nocardia TaxID=2637762 RepID=UPI003D2543F4
MLGGMMAAGLAGAGALCGHAGEADAAPKADSSAGPGPTGSLADVRHVVILMQENRSFDHYFGTMAGVRGFGDSTPVRLRSADASDPVPNPLRELFAGMGTGSATVGTATPRRGEGTVFAQPDPASGVGYRMPFHIDTRAVDGQDWGELDHGWPRTHEAWAGGRYDRWVPAKTDRTMGYFTEADIPFHRALAEAFTICDNYFCSVQGPTTPNRLYHWTGTIDPGGSHGGPATGNPSDYAPVFSWTTYPERLQAAGISWQVYANDVVGDDVDNHPFLGDYGDNPLWLFHAYHDALKSSDPAVRQLAQRANVTGAWPPANGQDGKNVDYVLEQFITACRTGSVPQVSWIVAPYGYSEHPAARPVDGEAYVQRVLKALWDNPELWRSTVLLINFDENDGLFDHVVPPTAPPGTPNELLPPAQSGVGTAAASSADSATLTPIGLGPRVPMLVVSPWSRGGWVNSQVFDHTSVLRFLEQWTGVREPNISDWRRSVCGDLLSCFDFGRPDTSIPALPDANVSRREADRTQAKLPMPSAPADQAMPHQDPGFAKVRPLPYQPVAWAEIGAGDLTLHLANGGREAVPFQAYAYLPIGGPAVTQIAVRGGGSTSRPFAWSGRYDIAVHAPNGFLFAAAGGPDTAGIEVRATVSGDPDAPELIVTVWNSTTATADFRIGKTDRCTVRSGATRDVSVPASDGWYDVTVTGTGDNSWFRRFAGHLEDGRPSRTG